MKKDNRKVGSLFMLFDDVFYPENPKRRKEVSELQVEIRRDFSDYKNYWNKWAGMLNDAFADCPAEPYKSFRITTLSKDIEKDTIKDCLDEITAAVNATNPTMKKVMDAMGIEQYLPEDWDKKGIKVTDMDKNSLLKAGKIISLSCSLALSGIVAYHIFQGVIVFTALSSAIMGTSALLGSLCAGALGGLVFSVTFVITDMISSAITGAIERKELNEALDALRDLKKKVGDPLHNQVIVLEGLCKNIKQNVFPLGDGYVLVQTSDNSYAIMGMVPLKAANFMQTASYTKQPRTSENMFIIIPAPLAS